MEAAISFEPLKCGSTGNTLLYVVITEDSMSTTVTSKGQVTIPKAVRDLLGIVPGSEVDFVLNDDGAVVLTRAGGKEPTSRFRKLLGHAGPGRSTDAIMALTRGEE